MDPDNVTTEPSIEKPSNENYEADINHTMRYTRWLLQLLGIWPLVSEDSSKVAKHFSKILIPLCLILQAFILVPGLHYMIVREKNMIAKLGLFTPLIYFLSNFFKFVFIVYRYDAIKHCLKYVKTDWMRIESERDRAIMMRNVKIGHNVTFICFGSMYSAVVSFHVIVPLLAGKTINEFNETVRMLVYPGYDTFVDPNKSPNYEIIFITICIAATAGCTISTTICNLSATFVTHACGQIEIVVSRLDTFVNEIHENRDNDKLQSRIAFVIQYHVRILRLSAVIEMVLREMCLVEAVASAVNICLLEYIILITWNNDSFLVTLTYVVSLMAVIFNMFILCHMGELLMEKSAGIGESTYMIDWYKLSGRTGLALIMVMAMSNFPSKLTAGKMVELSIFNFGSIIKTSFAYLNMLRTVIAVH